MRRFVFRSPRLGFLAVGGLARRKGFRFNKLRFRAWTAEWMVNGEKVLVMKPQTYMNLSGESVGEAARFYKIPADHVVVISDDISLPGGKLRLRTRGRARGGAHIFLRRTGQAIRRVFVSNVKKEAAHDEA